MATTVNLVTVKVFGEHADYPLAEISETAFGAWAREQWMQTLGSGS